LRQAAAWSRTISLCVAVFLYTGCSSYPRGNEVTETASQPVIYGADDRQQYYDIQSPAVRSLVATRSVALVPTDAVAIKDGQVLLRGPTWQAAAGLCPDVRLATDPVVASCSAILLAPDLVLTAGHCLSAVDCGSMAIVRGFRRDAPDHLAPIGLEDLAFCRSVIAWDPGEESQGDRLDYAWIELDHPLADPSSLRTGTGTADGSSAPVQFASEDAVSLGQPLVSFGYGGGGPVTMTAATVTNARIGHGDFFLTDLDAFQGMSGAPLFDSEQHLVGIDNRGAPDFVWDAAGRCYRPAVLAQNTGAEAATYALRALDALCALEPARSVCRPAGQLATVGGGCSVNGDHVTRPYFPGVLIPTLLALVAAARRMAGPRSGLISSASSLPHGLLPERIVAAGIPVLGAGALAMFAAGAGCTSGQSNLTTPDGGNPLGVSEAGGVGSPDGGSNGAAAEAGCPGLHGSLTRILEGDVYAARSACRKTPPRIRWPCGVRVVASACVGITAGVGTTACVVTMEAGHTAVSQLLANIAAEEDAPAASDGQTAPNEYDVGNPQYRGAPITDGRDT
jgi:V8-like Glu-specific endopeptidase